MRFSLSLLVASVILGVAVLCTVAQGPSTAEVDEAVAQDLADAQAQARVAAVTAARGLPSVE